MLKIIGIVLAVAILAILFLAVRKPDHFQVVRSITVSAPPEKIQGLLADFHQWSAWSPWEKLDPDMKRSFSGPESGPGSVYAWSGNSKVGAGRMEVLNSSPTDVTIKLDFLSPIEAHNTARFALRPEGSATHITWAMDGESNFVAKLMQVFLSMDKMVGKDFETGLANLKQRAES